MARAAREKSESGIYKIMLRSEGTMFLDREDYDGMAERIRKYLNVYAYAMLNNALCLIVKESEKGISHDMKPMTTSYARYFNTKYQKTGKLFSDRFKSKPVSEKSLAYETAALNKLLYFAGNNTAVFYRDESMIPKKEYDNSLHSITEPDSFYSVLIKNADKTVSGAQQSPPAPKPQPAPKPASKQKQATPPPPEPTPVPAAKKRRQQKMPSWLL